MHGSMAKIEDSVDRPKTTFDSRSHKIIAQKAPDVTRMLTPSETSVSFLL